MKDGDSQSGDSPRATGPDPEAVSAMFGRIAGRYDLVNHLLTCGIDIRWRNTLVKAVKATAPSRVVDLATGSGDVAFALRRALPAKTKIVGLDFCRPMLDKAEEKMATAGREVRNLSFAFGDVLDLPLEDNEADVLTIAFGLRNLADRNRGLCEMRRVLQTGGHLFILEFTQPARWIRPFYFPYLRHILPRLAGRISGDASAYRYLNTSIEGFPSKESITREIEVAGFASVRVRPMTGSIVTLHQATKG